jgi:hypothetical protein
VEDADGQRFWLFRVISSSFPSPSPGTPGEGWGGGGSPTSSNPPHPNPPPEYQGRGKYGPTHIRPPCPGIRWYLHGRFE